MKTLNVTISEGDFSQYGFSSNNIEFKEFLLNVKLELAKEALAKSVKLAEQYGLSSMTDEEIEEQIKSIRNEKRNS